MDVKIWVLKSQELVITQESGSKSKGNIIKQPGKGGALNR